MYTEKTLRKRAYKVGYRINKNKDGYQLIEVETGDVACGRKESFRCSIEDIESFLEEQFQSKGLKW